MKDMHLEVLVWVNLVTHLTYAAVTSQAGKGAGWRLGTPQGTGVSVQFTLWM
jgi:hypothetical protein